MFDYRILPEHRLILLRLSGRLSVSDILDFLAAVRVEPDYDASYASLVDIRALAPVLSAAEAERLVRFSTAPAAEATTRCAVVTASFFRAKLANISNLLSGRRHVTIRGFTEFGEALRWLELEPAAARCAEGWQAPAPAAVQWARPA